MPVESVQKISDTGQYQFKQAINFSAQGQYITHVVNEGDTLQEIWLAAQRFAEKYDYEIEVNNLEQIARDSGISNKNRIFVGDVIKIKVVKKENKASLSPETNTPPISPPLNPSDITTAPKVMGKSNPNRKPKRTKLDCQQYVLRGLQRRGVDTKKLVKDAATRFRKKVGGNQIIAMLCPESLNPFQYPYFRNYNELKEYIKQKYNLIPGQEFSGLFSFNGKGRGHFGFFSWEQTENGQWELFADHSSGTRRRGYKERKEPLELAFNRWKTYAHCRNAGVQVGQLLDGSAQLADYPSNRPIS